MGILKNIMDTVASKNSSKDSFFTKRNLDKFYIEFEDRFRGTEKEVATRQKVYLPRILSTSPSKEFPVIDIGCGRGEMLGLLRDSSLSAIGIDLNEQMILRAREKGLSVYREDAEKYLRKRSSGSVSAITGFHIVEHIPFENMLSLFEACFKSLKKDGIVIFETPNPENLIVGSCNFYNDPSHIKPIPPEVLKFAIESVGFTNAEILRLHPIKKNIESTDTLVKEIGEKLFGPQDYSVIATKP